MPNSPLTTKLHAHATLLPSQRELLERVIFQLEFNGYQHIHLVGKTGTGKTTLSLVLAELLSDEMDLAYFSAQPGMSTKDCQQQLLQQWFGLSDYESSLMKQLEQTHSQPLVWVLDSQGDLPHGCLSMLRAHPVHIITTGPDVLTEADINLTIPAITAVDAKQLLPDSALSAWALDERLAHAAGNLHRLLEPDTIAAEPVDNEVAHSSGRSAMRYRQASLALAVVGGLAIAAYWWMSGRQEPVEPSAAHLDNPSAAHLDNPSAALVDNALGAHQDELSAVQTDNRLAERFQASSLHQQTALRRVSEQEDSLDSTKSAVTAPDVSGTTTSEQGVAEEAELSDTQLRDDQLTTAAPDAPAESVKQQPDLTEQEPGVDTEILSEPLESDINISNRFQYQEEVLLAMDARSFALQLGAFATEAGAKRLVSTYPELKVHMFQRELNGQLQWVVVLAPFNDAAAARSERNVLADSLQAEVPFIKSISAIQQEINQRKIDESGEL